MSGLLLFVGRFMSKMLKKKWMYFVLLFFFIATITGGYNYSTGETYVFYSIDITESLLPARYDWEGYLVLYDDQFQYFWGVAIIGWIWGVCKHLFNSYSISNRLWIKFTPVQEEQWYKANVKVIFIFGLIILGIASLWAGIFGIINHLNLLILLMPGFGLFSHFLFSTSISLYLVRVFDPGATVPSSILFLVVLLPVVAGLVLGQVNESFEGWLPYAIMGQAEVREYPFYRPYLSLFLLSCIIFTLGYWKIEKQIFI